MPELAAKVLTTKINSENGVVDVTGPITGANQIKALTLSDNQKDALSKILTEEGVFQKKRSWSKTDTKSDSALMVVEGANGDFKIISGELHEKPSRNGLVSLGAGFGGFQPRTIKKDFIPLDVRMLTEDGAGPESEIKNAKKIKISDMAPDSKALTALVDTMPNPVKPIAIHRPLMDIPIEVPTGIPGGTGARGR